MTNLSAASTRSKFSLELLKRARMKPSWCSDVRWMIELRRRASGVDRGRRTDLEKQQYTTKRKEA